MSAVHCSTMFTESTQYKWDKLMAKRPKSHNYKTQDIVDAINKYEGDLVATAQFLELPLRTILGFVTENRSIRMLMEKYQRKYKALAQSKLHLAIKNDE